MVGAGDGEGFEAAYTDAVVSEHMVDRHLGRDPHAWSEVGPSRRQALADDRGGVAVSGGEKAAQLDVIEGGVEVADEDA